MKRKRMMGILALSFLMLFALIPQALANDGDGVTTSDIIALVENFDNNGQILNSSVVRALTMHLTAVGHFEQQGQTDKVVGHMNSFKLLLEQQFNHNLIDESVYDSLIEQTDLLIGYQNPLTIVQNGQANAVIITPSGTSSTNTPEWSHWSNYSGSNVVRSEVVAHSGSSSLMLDGMRQGGVAQMIPIQLGTISAQVYYYTGEESAGQFRIGIHLRDENGNNMRTFRTETTMLADTTGEWALASLHGEVPEEINGRDIVAAQVVITVENSEDVPVYFDDYVVNQNDEDLNLLKNPGFEEKTTHYEPGETFLEYVEKSTGVRLPMATSESEDGEAVRIYIGESSSEDEARHQDLLQNLNEHGYIIDPQDGRITILGTTERATRYGVYEFLERYLGVSWLMPGPDGEYVPELDVVSIPRVLVSDEPATISRHFFIHHDTQHSNEWTHKNRMHHNIQFHHNMNVLFDPTVFADHPEYYTNGQVPTHAYAWQPCFNNETAGAAIQRIIDYFDANPEASSYSLGLNDSSNHCAKDLVEKNSIGKDNRSDEYYPWVNQIAEGVAVAYPDKYLGLLAYHETFDAPKKEDGTLLKLHPNVVPYLTDDRMSWMDPDIEQAAKQHIEEWGQSAEHLGFYDYMYGAAYNMPRTYTHQMDENYKYADEKDVIGHVAEVSPNFGGEGPKMWVSTKLQWDPNRDVDQLLNEWYTKAVGEEAAPYLQQYYEFWEEVWTERMLDSTWFRIWADSTTRANFLNFNDSSYLVEVTAEEIEAARDLLEQVIALANPGKQQVRAELFLQAFEYYEASVLSYPISDEVVTPTNEEDALAMLAKIIESYEMAQKRDSLWLEFQTDPILKMYGPKRGHWDGILTNHITALEAYAETEPEGGTVGDQLVQFLTQIGFIDVSAKAVKTTASKAEILQTLDFSQGPWTEAIPFDNFFIMNSSNTPPVETNVYLLWDEENLYVGYENFDDDLSGMIISDVRPNGWWSSGYDDSVETFVTGNPNAPYLGYFTNPEAAGFSRYQGTVVTGVDWDASADIGTDRWTTIQSIPFSEIGIDPTETKTLSGLFFRNYHGSSVHIGWDGGAPWRIESFRPVHLVE